MQIVLIFTCFEQCVLIFEVTPRTAEVQNVLSLASFEQYFPICEVTPRTAGNAQCIDFCKLRAMFSCL